MFVRVIFIKVVVTRVLLIVQLQAVLVLAIRSRTMSSTCGLNQTVLELHMKTATGVI